jgi:hypothetical protein
MSPRIHFAGTHFSEIFASRLGFDLTTYARAAMSNGGIALQILQAIEDKPDLIIFNLTFPDRIEFSLDVSLQMKPTQKDLYYKYEPPLELSTVNGNPGNLVSDNIASILSDHPNRHSLIYPKEKVEAVRTYFNELYSPDWKYLSDCMTMYSILHVLHKSGINYIMYCDKLNLTKIVDTKFKPDWMHPKNDISNDIEDYLSRPTGESVGYHTTIQTQSEIAEYIINHYNKYFR